MERETIYINGVDIAGLGVKALRDYRIGGTEITNYEWQGTNRSQFLNLFSKYGLKQLDFTLVFTGTRRRNVEEMRSRVTMMLYGISEIRMPDEFTYRCLLDSVGEGEWQGQEGNGWLLFVPYTLRGIQHDALVTVPDGRTRFYVEATLPQMDACLTVRVSTAASQYVLAGATFGAVAAGDVLVFDGINKRILKNGAPTTATGYFEFPCVKHGWNLFTALDAVQVDYYPCYL